MLVKGDVKCLHCGFISGSWVGQKGIPVTVAGFTPGLAAGNAACADPASAVRCARCDGPVFLEDVEPVISGYRIRRIRRLREQIAALDARGGKAA
ncbi:MAG: hypothetical protein WD557_02985 [Dehalococcoidia bacterium]